MNTTTVLVVVAVAGLVLYRQFAGRFARPGNRDLVISLVIVASGVLGLVAAQPAVTAAGVAVVAGELVLAIGLGVVRGNAFRLEERDGWLYQRGSVTMLLAWIATVGVRAGASLVAGAVAGPLLAATSGLVFGASLAVQALVMTRRIAADPRPIRPAAGRRDLARTAR